MLLPSSYDAEREKYARVLNRLISYEVNFSGRVDGQTAYLTTIRDAVQKIIRGRPSHEPRWYVCGPASKHSVGAGADEGYTCGLWLLMHYLTGLCFICSFVLRMIISK